jgi:hypothetical protein
MRAASARLLRLCGARVAAAVASLALSGLLACASSTAALPTPAAKDPAEQLIVSLTEALRLDASQQQKTRELLRELADRDDRIRAGWANGQRVQPKALVDSHKQFERDFAAILSEEQRKIYIENKTRLMLQARTGGLVMPH